MTENETYFSLCWEISCSWAFWHLCYPFMKNIHKSVYLYRCKICIENMVSSKSTCYLYLKQWSMKNIESGTQCNCLKPQYLILCLSQLQVHKPLFCNYGMCYDYEFEMEIITKLSICLYASLFCLLLFPLKEQWKWTFEILK